MKKCDICGERIEGKVHVEYDENGLRLNLCDFCAEPTEDHEYQD